MSKQYDPAVDAIMSIAVRDATQYLQHAVREAIAKGLEVTVEVLHHQHTRGGVPDPIIVTTVRRVIPPEIRTPMT